MNRVLLGLTLCALAGCAQLPPANNAHTDPPLPQKTVGALFEFTVPPDALGAHDRQLSSVLNKTGALAARQAQPTVITVSALAQDFHYLDQELRAGIPARRLGAVRIDNVTAGSCQPYSVRVRAVQ